MKTKYLLLIASLGFLSLFLQGVRADSVPLPLEKKGQEIIQDEASCFAPKMKMNPVETEEITKIVNELIDRIAGTSDLSTEVSNAGEESFLTDQAGFSVGGSLTIYRMLLRGH